MAQPNTTDKLAVLKYHADPFISNKIDIFKLSDEDLDKLYEIANKQQRGFGISFDDYKIISQIRADYQNNGKKSVGIWNGEKPKEIRLTFIPKEEKKPLVNFRWNK